MDGLGHGGRAGVLALDHVLARGLLVCPQDGLGDGALEGVGDWRDAVAVDGQDDKVVLLLGLLGDGQAEDLVDIFTGNGKLDVAGRIHGADAAVGRVEQLEGELFALGQGEADSGKGAPWRGGGVCEGVCC